MTLASLRKEKNKICRCIASVDAVKIKVDGTTIIRKYN